MSAAGTMTPGDIYGFAALFLIALAAALMLLRSFLIKWTKNIALVRAIHLGLSTMAGFFLMLHISVQFVLPVSLGIMAGYVAVAVSVVAWMSGTAFLQKVKDSLFFHGVLSAALIPLIMIHAATSSVNIPLYWSNVLLGGTAAVVLANAGLHIKRALSSVPR